MKGEDVFCYRYILLEHEPGKMGVQGRENVNSILWFCMEREVL